MYFLVEGECFAQKDINGTATSVKDYISGDYFGELALLRNEPRAASIIAKTKVTTVSMDRHAFKRMLGPLEELLKRNVDLYT
jgi:cAMP-dependent protein kinase regulator